MAPLIPGVLFLIWIVLISAALGGRLLSIIRFEARNSTEHLLLSTGLGLGALQYLPFSLFSVGLGHPAVIRAAAVAVTALLAVDIRKALGRFHGLIRSSNAPTWLRVFISLYALLLAASFLRALSPSLAGDGLDYHLTAATRPLQTGRFVYLPTLTYTNWPCGTEMLFSLLLGISYKAPSALIQFAAGLLVCGTIWVLANRLSGKTTAVISLILLLLITDFWAEICVSMVDVTLTAFTMLAIMCLQHVFLDENESETRWDVLAALFAGLAATTKLTGFWVIVCSSSMYILIQFKRSRSISPIRTFVFTATSVAVVTPWLIKSWVLTGNPIYPLLYRWLGGIEWSATAWTRFQLAHLIYNTPRGMQPTPAVLQHTHLMYASAGVAVFIAIAIGAWRTRRYCVLLTAFGVFLACISIGNYFNPRFLMPALPALLVVVGCWISGIRRLQTREWMLSCIALSLIIPLLQKSPKAWVPNLPDAVELALGRLSAETYQLDNISEYHVSAYANSHLPSTARILIDGRQSTGLYHAVAMISAFNLQDSLHFGSQTELITDLRRLGVTNLVLTQYPDDCDSNHACRMCKDAERPALEELARTHGSVLYRQGNSRLYALNLSASPKPDSP